MSAATIAQLKIAESPVYSKPPRNRSGRPTTLEEFLVWNPHDGFKYEWDNGNLLKLPKMVTAEQYHIIYNLTDLFLTTKAYKQEGAGFTPEVQSRTTQTQVRVPDIGYFTMQQRKEMATGKTVVPEFAIEIISPTDKAINVHRKRNEYFNAGMKVLWQIFPDLEEVYIYTANDTIEVCWGNKICSAESVIEGFALPANEIFKKP